MRFGLFATALLLVTGMATGCATVARPDWRHPGPAELQQQRAALYDPYPDNDGGPAVEGGRPPSYDTPPPDFVRSKNYHEGWWARPR